MTEVDDSRGETEEQVGGEQKEESRIPTPGGLRTLV